MKFSFDFQEESRLLSPKSNSRIGSKSEQRTGTIIKRSTYAVSQKRDVYQPGTIGVLTNESNIFVVADKY